MTATADRADVTNSDSNGFIIFEIACYPDFMLKIQLQPRHEIKSARVVAVGIKILFVC